MITADSLEQIGKRLLANAVTRGGFSAEFNELRILKTKIQNEATNVINSPQELQDILLSRKNECVIEKLVRIGKKYYRENATDVRAYMVSMAVGTIIKEYGWGNDYVNKNGLFELAKKIIS